MRMRRQLWGALGLLTAGLSITVLTSHYIKAGVDESVQREFDFACNEIRLNIDARLEAAAQILRSGAALFDATERVSRGEWRTFAQRLQIEHYLPGIQGIGFALLIPREQLDQHVQAIRREGFPDYQVRPAGQRESYSAIIYLEPFSDRNLRAFGYDMLSEPVRRAAMERARDENTAALSGKVILVQETGQDVQAGVLMYVPVSRHGLPIETIEQRRAALQGWVYSPYRMTDLMRGTLENWDVKEKGSRISLQVYDGAVLSADTLLYDSQGAKTATRLSFAPITRLTPVDFAGRRWTLRFTHPGGLVSLAGYRSAWLVLFGGTVSSLLLFGLMIWRQQRIRFDRDKAEAKEALKSSEERFRIAAENLTDVVYDWDIKEKIDWYGDIDGMTGYPTGGFPRTFSAWAATLQPEDHDRVTVALEAHLKGEAPFNVEYRVRKRNGESRWWSARGTALRDERGEPHKMIGSITDITERKHAEEALAGLQQEQKLASIGTLARGMAHEINNPIMGIANYAQLIKDRAADNANLAGFADEILAESKRVARMTHSLLNFTQQDSTQEMAPAALADIVASVLAPVEEAVRQRGIALSCDISTDLPAVLCRKNRIGEVVTALLENAMETWGKGPLDAASPEAIQGKRLGGGDKAIHMTAKQFDKTGQPWVRLTVEDNGPGIPEKLWDRVFDAFFTTKDRTRHSGLGLWISRSIVQEHGGEIAVESPSTTRPSSPGNSVEASRAGGVGQWTRVHVELPVAPEPSDMSRNKVPKTT